MPRLPAESSKVFVAGATGAIGASLIPQLVEAGHHLTAITRSPERAERLAGAGVTATVCDVFDADALTEAVTAARPDVVVNQLTDLPKSGLSARRLDEYYAANNRVRGTGTANLVAAALAAGASRFVSQSIGFWYRPVGGLIKTEEDPLWHGAPEPIGAAVATVAAAERAVLEADEMVGIVLRYGTFYGPRTWYSRDGEIGRQIERRRYPIVGDGSGYTSFVHVDDAASACVAFVAAGAGGVYNVVDDEPATANEWVPEFARAIGAKRPMRVPKLVARAAAGGALAEWSATARGASNEKLKREVEWPRTYATWCEGFATGLG